MLTRNPAMCAHQGDGLAATDNLLKLNAMHLHRAIKNTAEDQQKRKARIDAFINLHERSMALKREQARAARAAQYAAGPPSPVLASPRAMERPSSPVLGGPSPLKRAFHGTGFARHVAAADGEGRSGEPMEFAGIDFAVGKVPTAPRKPRAHPLKGKTIAGNAKTPVPNAKTAPKGKTAAHKGRLTLKGAAVQRKSSLGSSQTTSRLDTAATVAAAVEAPPSRGVTTQQPGYAWHATAVGAGQGSGAGGCPATASGRASHDVDQIQAYLDIEMGEAAPQHPAGFDPPVITMEEASRDFGIPLAEPMMVDDDDMVAEDPINTTLGVSTKASSELPVYGQMTADSQYEQMYAMYMASQQAASAGYSPGNVQASAGYTQGDMTAALGYNQYNSTHAAYGMSASRATTMAMPSYDAARMYATAGNPNTNGGYLGQSYAAQMSAQQHLYGSTIPQSGAYYDQYSHCLPTNTSMAMAPMPAYNQMQISCPEQYWSRRPASMTGAARM